MSHNDSLENGLTFAVVGSGPVGIHAALHILRNQPALKFKLKKVILIEQGNCICANIKQWSFVRLFSNWSFNVSKEGLQTLTDMGIGHPDPSTYPTGKEYIEQYLKYLSHAVSENPKGEVRLKTKVISIGRRHLLKGSAIGQRKPLGHGGFQIFVTDSENGEENLLEADVVFDITGTYGNHNFYGAGGVPALGEKKLNSDYVKYIIPDVLGSDRFRYSGGKRILVIGSGFSAITTINNLLELNKEEQTDVNQRQKMHIYWLTRRGKSPYERVENDPLPQRDELADLGNQLSSTFKEDTDINDFNSDVRVTYLGARGIYKVSNNNNEVDVQLFKLQKDPNEHNNMSKVEFLASLATYSVDQIISCCGFRPDLSIESELQVHPCWATDGPIKLAATLLPKTGAGTFNCLNQSFPGPDLFKHPEPDFFILGGKSYGRSSKFIVKVGLEQIEQVFGLYT